MKNFNTERIEIILIITGAFFAAYIFMMGLISVLNAIYAVMN